VCFHGLLPHYSAAQPRRREARRRSRHAYTLHVTDLERRTGHYPQVGGEFDMLDHFEGRFLWERSDEEMVDDPPSRVDYEVLAVDPLAPPTAPGVVKVQVRIVF
jgi:hypothetical protein